MLALKRLLLSLFSVTVACEYTRPPFPILGYEQDEVACSDGLDNDRDGLVDCRDPECFFTVLCGEYIPLVPAPRQAENSLELSTPSEQVAHSSHSWRRSDYRERTFGRPLRRRP